MTERLGPAFFDDLYAADPDPWDFESSPYEAAKYDATIAALRRTPIRHVPWRSAARSVCSLTACHGSATRCWRSTSPKRRWSGRKPRVPDVAFERREVPEEFPDGAYDLIVASEVLYYLDAPAFDATLDAIERTLDGTLLAVHWRPLAERYPLTGDAGPRAAARPASATPAYCRRTDKFNLDRFDACGS